MKRCLSIVAVSCGIVLSSWADASLMNTCFQFETQGDDCYADGTMLAEGECYALVWRHNDLAGSIEGLFNSMGSPVNPQKCEILGVFNTATHQELDGHSYACATNSWIILPSGHYEAKSSTGVYSLFVFDTRTWDGQKWILGGKTSDTTVASLRRYGLVTDFEDIKLGTGVGGTFFPYNTSLYGTAFVGNPNFTSLGDVSVLYSCADTPTVGETQQKCSISFFADEETVTDTQMRVAGQAFGTLPVPEAREGFAFVGWFTPKGEQVTSSTIVTGDVRLLARWAADDGRVPLFSSVMIANGKAYLSVTNTSTSLQYGISWVTNVGEVFSKTNWVNGAKQGVGDAPLTWEIDLKGEPQGFFRVLRK